MMRQPIRSGGWIPALLLSLGFFVQASWAQTSDGETPAEEGICDGLHDASPGLYGLCVAYCEAQDCDTIDLAISGQCGAPSQRVFDHYEKKRQPEDPPMPCLPLETK